MKDARHETLSVGDTVQVLINLDAFTSPHDFYVVRSVNRPHLDDLLMTMNNLYRDSKPVPDYVPAKDDLCVAPTVKNIYHRACVLSTANDWVQVNFVDLGTSTRMEISALRRITVELLKLPLQAIAAQLDGVSPSCYTTHAIRDIKMVLQEKPRYMAKAVSRNTVTDKYSIHLETPERSNVLSILRSKNLISGGDPSSSPSRTSQPQEKNQVYSQGQRSRGNGQHNYRGGHREGGEDRHIQNTRYNQDGQGRAGGRGRGGSRGRCDGGFQDRDCGFNGRDRGFNGRDRGQGGRDRGTGRGGHRGGRFGQAEAGTNKDDCSSEQSQAPGKKALSDDRKPTISKADADLNKDQHLSTSLVDTKPTINTAADLTKGQDIQVVISHPESPSQFFVQIYNETMEKQMEKLQAELQTEYGNLEANKALYPEGFIKSDPLVAAIHPGYNQYYRAKVIRRAKEGYKVRYVDFGDTADVPVVHPLKHNFYSQPLFAVECSLHGVSSSNVAQWTPQARELFATSCLDSSGNETMLAATVEELSNGCVSLTIKSPKNNISLADILVKAGMAVPSDKSNNGGVEQGSTGGTPLQNAALSPKSSASPPKMTVSQKIAGVVLVDSLPHRELGVGSETTVAVMYASSIDHITVVDIAQDGEAHQKLAETLQTLQAEHSGQYQPKVAGELVLAQFTDGLWYRAEVMKISPQSAQVLFVDYGNIDEVGNDKLAPAGKDVTKQLVFGIWCKLEGVDGLASGKQWSNELIDASGSYTVKVIKREGWKHVVEMSAGVVSVREKLINDGIATPSMVGLATPQVVGSVTMFVKDLPQWQPPNTTDKIKCMITAAESISEIRIQSESDLENLSAVTGLLDGIKPPVGYTPTSGELVIGQFSGDQHWYRADVKAIKGTVYILDYVDFGNTEESTVDKIAKIPNDLKKYPALSPVCKLSAVVEDTPLPADLIDFSVAYEVKFLKEGNNKWIVELYKEGECINTILAKAVSPPQPQRALTSPPPLDKSIPAAEKTMPSVQKATPPEVKSMPPVQENSPPTLEKTTPPSHEQPTLTSLPPLADLPLNQPLQALCIHVNSPADFYIVLNSDYEKLAKIAQTSAALTDTSPCTAKPGEVISFLAEGEYNRMLVLNVESGVSRLRSIDYGSLHECAKGEMRTLHQEYLSLPRIAYSCSLDGVQGRGGAEYTDDEVAKAYALIYQRGLEVMVKRLDGTTAVVSASIVLDNEQKVDVAELLIKEGVAKPLSQMVDGVEPKVKPEAGLDIPSVTATTLPKVTTPDEFQGRVCVFNTPHSFFVRPETASDQLHVDINLYCQKTTPDKTFRPDVDQVCCVYNKDQEWYRGLILEKGERDCRVHFVDYGDEGMIVYSRMRPMSAALAQEAPQAFHCRLHDTEAPRPSGWNQDELSKLTKTFIDLEFTVTVTGRHDNLLDVTLAGSGSDDVITDLAKQELVVISTVKSKSTDEEKAVTNEDKAKELLIAQIAEMQQRLAQMQKK